MSGKRTGEKGGGFMLMKPLIETAGKPRAVRAEYDMRVQRLVVDGDRVVGIIAKQYGKEVAVRARTAVSFWRREASPTTKR